jgi:hypothetical protein
VEGSSEISKSTIAGDEGIESDDRRGEAPAGDLVEQVAGERHVAAIAVAADEEVERAEARRKACVEELLVEMPGGMRRVRTDQVGEDAMEKRLALMTWR